MKQGSWAELVVLAHLTNLNKYKDKLIHPKLESVNLKYKRLPDLSSDNSVTSPPANPNGYNGSPLAA